MVRFRQAADVIPGLTLLIVLLASPTIATADDRIWPQIGMSGAEAAKLFEGKCPELWQPAPYITCIRGKHVITATSSAKDRIYYIQRREPTDADRGIYSAKVAAELGFEGQGQQCMRHNSPAICWTKPDGTALFAAMVAEPGLLVTQLHNETIEFSDGPP